MNHIDRDGRFPQKLFDLDKSGAGRQVDMRGAHARCAQHVVNGDDELLAIGLAAELDKQQLAPGACAQCGTEPAEVCRVFRS